MQGLSPRYRLLFAGFLLGSALGIRLYPLHAQPLVPPSLPISTMPALSPTNQSLLAAAESGDVNAARQALAQGATVDCRTTAFATPLMRAAYFGHLEMVRFLLEFGADPLTRNGQGMSVLLIAVTAPWSDNQPRQESLWAAKREIVRLLLVRNANPRARDTLGQTPLHKAASIGDLELVRLLLAAGASVRDADTNSSTPLLRATTPEVFRLLLAVKDPGGNPVSLANSYASVLLLHVVQLYCRLPADKNTADWLALTRQLLAAGAAVNTRMTWGQTSLHMAARIQSLDLVRVLLEAGANPNLVDGDRYTPTILACQTSAFEGAELHQQRLEILRLLQKAGANIHLRDAQGDSALLFAVDSGDIGAVRFLISKGVSIRERGQNGTTVLHRAASQADPEMIQYLIRAGAEVNAQTRRDPNNNEEVFGETPLMFAVTANTEDLLPALHILLDAGADVSRRDSEGHTVLHYFAFGSSGGQKVCSLLLERGAQREARDRDGSTPLALAVQSGNLISAQALVRAGADPNARRKDGETPLTIQRQRTQNLRPQDSDWKMEQATLELLKAAADGIPLPQEVNNFFYRGRFETCGMTQEPSHNDTLRDTNSRVSKWEEKANTLRGLITWG